MQHGDISNEVAPRLLFVFEGTVAAPSSTAAEKMEKLHIRLRRWDKAVECWEISERSYALLWDCTWRHNFRFDIVTYRPAGFAVALKERLNVEGLPVGNIWATTPARLSKRLAFMPDVAAVYDADATRLFTYGGRGVHLDGGLAAQTVLW